MPLEAIDDMMVKSVVVMCHHTCMYVQGPYIEEMLKQARFSSQMSNVLRYSAIRGAREGFSLYTLPLSG